ncbi:alpha/beta fold hydrolase [Vannielia litorea]|uniref:alpha/beta fold hydrolase n=1 Tax=Vannielia litorea TaxID=1217970 RepID=UPI001BD18AD4|nr:alpha/beta fold hydrolase [Vannielia litorea]MBS8229011.1 alpha/beta fold hydrolase [Vannielia litorea]
MLAITRYEGDTSAPTLLIAHGLFGSARNWNVIAKRLSGPRPVISVDMRNHGKSPWFDSHSYADLADDLAEVIEAEGAPVDLLGHSMGGKTSMVLALSRPELIRRLVVADIAPVAYSHTQGHLIEAMRGLDLSGLSSRSEADKRLAASIDEASVRAFLLQSLDLKADPPRWRLNLDALDAEMGKIVGWPEPTGQFNGPTLFAAGGESDYIQPSARPTIKALFPEARQIKIPGAGHWLHAEKPREFEAAVEAFLSA